MMNTIYHNKHITGKRIVLGLLLATSLLASACGPQISKQVRYEWSVFDQAETKQEREGLTVETKLVDKDFPPTLYAVVQNCNTSTGALLVGPDGKPSMFQIQLAGPNQRWYQVALTNNTDHVVRLNNVIVRLFDPAGNQYEPFSKEDLATDLTRSWPCPTASIAAQQYKVIKLLDRNAEMLPNTTTTGWIVFKPASLGILGVWKLAIYEVPVATDEAGKVSKTTKFETRTVVKKFVDTYRRENLMAPDELVESQEVTE